jgi:hypothetical protein
MDGYKVCETCGGFYLNFCLRCAKTGLAERVWKLMGENNLNEETLIKLLAEQVTEGNFSALNLAITMRDLKPANKVEVNDSSGKDISDARDRLGSLLSRLSTRARKEQDS